MIRVVMPYNFSNYLNQDNSKQIVNLSISSQMDLCTYQVSIIVQGLQLSRFGIDVIDH
jgi:hypothetical protein